MAIVASWFMSLRPDPYDLWPLFLKLLSVLRPWPCLEVLENWISYNLKFIATLFDKFEQSYSQKKTILTFDLCWSSCMQAATCGLVG